MTSRGALLTVVLANAVAGWATSALRIDEVLCRTVPSAMGVLMVAETTTEPLAPAASVPMFQSTCCPEAIPWLVADTKVVSAGRTSCSCTFVAWSEPVLR